jgi:hypothetical protein
MKSKSDARRLSVELDKVLAGDMDPSSQPHQWPLEVRFIYEMRQFGFDQHAVLELLQDEFPEVTITEIKRRIKPFRALARKWYSMGDKIVHGLICGWMAAMEK